MDFCHSGTDTNINGEIITGGINKDKMYVTMYADKPAYGKTTLFLNKDKSYELVAAILTHWTQNV